MCNPKTIRKIYSDFYLLEHMKMPPKYYNASKKVDKLKEELKTQLNSSNGKELLESLGNAYIDMSSIDSEQSFIDGFSFAARIISEAFLQEVKNADN